MKVWETLLYSIERNNCSL